MARKRVDDYIQGYRYAVLEATGTILSATAGFKSVTMPDISLASVEYRDGLTLYTKKQPGLPTIGNGTLIQGVTQKQSEFFKWIKRAAEGAEYRADITIQVHDSSNKTPPSVVKTVEWMEAFPARVKPVGDLDATSAEILLREIEIVVEEVREDPA